MDNFFVPYIGKKPASVCINGHRLVMSRLVYTAIYAVAGRINFAALDWIGVGAIAAAVLLAVFATGGGAVGTGIGRQLGWKDMEIRKHDSGAPFVVLHGKGGELAQAQGVTEVLVSLSHCKDYGAASAVAVG